MTQDCLDEVCETERRRIIALCEHNTHGPSSILYLRPRAFRWVDLLSTAELQERATSEIGGVDTIGRLKLVLEGFAQ